jgi:hypothetical protein
MHGLTSLQVPLVSAQCGHPIQIAVVDLVL